MDIKALKQELAEKQKVMQEGQAAAEKARDVYLAEFAPWLEAHSDIAVAQDVADETAKVAKTEFAETRKRIAEELSLHFTRKPEDAKLEPAFGLRRSAEPIYTGGIEFIQAVVKSGMLFLLMPDKEAITAFVKGMAIENKDKVVPYVLPSKVLDTLPMLGVQTVFKAIISDSKL